MNKYTWFTKASRRPTLLYRSTLLELFTATDLYKEKLYIDEKLIQVGNFVEHENPTLEENVSNHYKSYFPENSYDTHYLLFTDGKFVYGLDNFNNKLGCLVLCKYGEIPFPIYSKFTLSNTDIENYTGNGEYTTVGCYLANYFSLASTFGSIIPYVNGVFSIGDVEKIIGAKALAQEVTIDQIHKYLNHTFFLGSFSELIVPVFSEKSLTTDPKVAKRKKELLEQYKDQLNDPVICSKIEDELIAMDKEWLKGDPSMGFYGSASKKFNVHRKRQFLAAGLIEEFSGTKGNYNFISGALSDGWEKDSFATWCNDIRKGSYNRGIETAKGGVQTKYLLRMFQSTKIVAEDCGTKRGLLVTFTSSNVKDFYGCNIILPSGKLETLTSRNAKQYLNTTQKIRSVMYCEEKDGFCFTCAGDSYRTLDIKAIGATALELGSAFLLTAMKAMHGTKMSSAQLNNLDDFTVGVINRG